MHRTNGEHSAQTSACVVGIEHRQEGKWHVRERSLLQVTPSSPVEVYWRFAGSSRFHLQEKKAGQPSISKERSQKPQIPRPRILIPVLSTSLPSRDVSSSYYLFYRTHQSPSYFLWFSLTKWTLWGVQKPFSLLSQPPCLSSDLNIPYHFFYPEDGTNKFVRNDVTYRISEGCNVNAQVSCEPHILVSGTHLGTATNLPPSFFNYF
jgi:hypothetical protein